MFEYNAESQGDGVWCFSLINHVPAWRLNRIIPESQQSIVTQLITRPLGKQQHIISDTITERDTCRPRFRLLPHLHVYCHSTYLLARYRPTLNLLTTAASLTEVRVLDKIVATKFISVAYSRKENVYDHLPLQELICFLLVITTYMYPRVLPAFILRYLTVQRLHTQ